MQPSPSLDKLLISVDPLLHLYALPQPLLRPAFCDNIRCLILPLLLALGGHSTADVLKWQFSPWRRLTVSLLFNNPPFQEQLSKLGAPSSGGQTCCTNRVLIYWCSSDVAEVILIYSFPQLLLNDFKHVIASTTFHITVHGGHHKVQTIREAKQLRCD